MLKKRTRISLETGGVILKLRRREQLSVERVPEALLPEGTQERPIEINDDPNYIDVRVLNRETLTLRRRLACSMLVSPNFTLERVKHQDHDLQIAVPARTMVHQGNLLTLEQTHYLIRDPTYSFTQYDQLMESTPPDQHKAIRLQLKVQYMTWFVSAFTRDLCLAITKSN